MPPDAPRPGGIGAAVAAAERRARESLLRGHGGGHAPVSYLELFFDLVFVFAITQLSHTLHHHLSWHGFAEALVMFLAVWWGWIYTTWVANWANPDRLPVRLLLLAVMLASLLMAVAIPEAFGRHGLVFAGAYLALQLGRSAWTTWIFRREGADRMRNMARITAWFCLSAPLWLAGGLSADADQRLVLWAAALAIEYAGPWQMFWFPGLGRSKGSDWDISGSHMAERCALFVIIALGEGIVVTGAAVADAPLEPGLTTAFVTAFVGSALMWWLYFDMGAQRGAQFISGHAQAGRVARNAFIYLHMPIVLGVVIGAVGDALLLEQWNRPVSPAMVATNAGGLLLFMGGLGLFKRFSNPIGNFPLSHGVAMTALNLIALAALRWPVSTLDFALRCVAVLLVTAVWEWVSYHGGWMERLERLGVPYPRRVRERFERRRAEIEAKRR